MLLPETLRDPLQGLIYMQRYVNEGSKSGYHSLFPDPYDPFCWAANFPLPYVKIPLDHSGLSLARGLSASPIDSMVFEDRAIKFYLHPLMWTPYGDELLRHAVDRQISHIKVCGPLLLEEPRLAEEALSSEWLQV